MKLLQANTVNTTEPLVTTLCHIYYRKLAHVAKLGEITGKTRVLYAELGEVTGKTRVLPCQGDFEHVKSKKNVVISQGNHCLLRDRKEGEGRFLKSPATKCGTK